jgi:vesicle coat complex subunit
MYNSENITLDPSSVVPMSTPSTPTPLNCAKHSRDFQKAYGKLFQELEEIFNDIIIIGWQIKGNQYINYVRASKCFNNPD